MPAGSELAQYALLSESDVFLARRRARDAAAALGLDGGDQVRVATAVSELGRVVVAAGLQAQILITAEIGASARLIVTVSANGSLERVGDQAERDALRPAERLMDSLMVISHDPLQVAMTKAGPRIVAGSPPIDLGDVRARLKDSLTPSPLEELRAQNAELLAAMEQLTAQQQALVRVNDELAETNRGVVAMYSQLSEEMEETNRGVVALYADLEDRGAQLREANAAKSRFLASVSHELRSPLNSVLGLSDLLLDPESSTLTAAQRRQVGLIRSSGRDLLALVNDLLDVAKAEAGKLDPRFEDVDLASLLADLRATTRPLVRDGVEVTIDLAGEAQVVRSDPALLSRCLRNLLSNAAKFTETGEIAVTAQAIDSSSVRIRVRDTGIGIAADHQELVFEEFHQVPGRLQVGVKGSGLGLPYARRVAHALGGTLTLQSEPGSGATFDLTLRGAITNGSPPSPPTGGQALRSVLIVDDDEAMRAVLRGMLAGAVTHVAEAHDAITAIEQMRAAEPEVVVLDLRMSGGDGYQVLQLAQQDIALSRIPIVVLTSVEPADRDIERLSQAKAVLSKTGLVRQSLVGALRAAARAAS